MLAAAIACADAEAAMVATVPPDPNNPTCPKSLNWSTYRQMRFTLFETEARRILKAEGVIDAEAAARLADALKEHDPIDEIWLRSPGGDARAGNEAGTIIRKLGIPTRIPAGLGLLLGLQLHLHGRPDPLRRRRRAFRRPHVHAPCRQGCGPRRARPERRRSRSRLIGEVEQDSAMLASEDNDFLIRMGVSRKLLTEVMYKQKAVAAGGDKSTRRCLTTRRGREIQCRQRTMSLEVER